MNYKKIINLFAIVVIIVLIIYGIYFALKVNKVFDAKKQTETINNIYFVSDSNILKALNQLKDANRIIIYGEIDKDNKLKTYILGNSVLFIELFTASGKDTATYLLFNKTEECSVVDKDKNMVGVYDKSICSNILKNNNIIYLEGVDNTLELPRIDIEKNIFKITNTSVSNSIKENEQFIELFIPNIKEIENKIRNYINKIDNSTLSKINS